MGLTTTKADTNNAAVTNVGMKAAATALKEEGPLGYSSYVSEGFDNSQESQCGVFEELSEGSRLKLGFSSHRKLVLELELYILICHHHWCHC